MATHLTYPNYPYSVTLPVAKVRENLELEPGPSDQHSVASWLAQMVGGPLLITALSGDPDLPMEQPRILLPSTEQIEVWELDDVVSRYMIGRGTHEAALDVEFVRFNFALPSTALQFKLAWGGN